MSQLATSPDLSTLEIPIDAWTQGFWDAAAEHSLLLPRCANCRTCRWPPGPFCPRCQSQAVDWVSAGQGRIYSYTVVADGAERTQVPALIEFREADRVRVLAPIVDTPIELVRIGAVVSTRWTRAANANVPVFTVERER